MHHTRLHLVTALLLTLAFTFTARAAGEGGSQIKATLLADAAAIEPGQSFMLGVHMKIQPLWHTYWINPGDSGDPTRIKLKAEGITFGEIQWPIPMRFDGDGYVSFGYENEVLLLVPAKASAKLKPGTRVTIDAQVNWLVCHETCIEGGANLSITLPVESKAKAENEKLFAYWQAKLPAACPECESVPLASVKQGKKSDGSPEPTVALQWKTAVKNVEWYPIAGTALAIDKVKIEHDGKTTTIRFRSEIYKPEKLPTGEIDTVVVYTDADGRRVGITVPVAVLEPEK